MLYAQFFQKSAISDEIIEACGDRSVVVYDGRRAVASYNDEAKRECAKRGYVGFQFFKGETFTRSSPVSEYVPLY
jgi:hypothetical protein